LLNFNNRRLAFDLWRGWSRRLFLRLSHGRWGRGRFNCRRGGFCGFGLALCRRRSFSSFSQFGLDLLAELIRPAVFDRVGVRRDRHTHVLQLVNRLGIIEV
jgi:hypothetical protein